MVYSYLKQCPRIVYPPCLMSLQLVSLHFLYIIYLLYKMIFRCFKCVLFSFSVRFLVVLMLPYCMSVYFLQEFCLIQASFRCKFPFLIISFHWILLKPMIELYIFSDLHNHQVECQVFLVFLHSDSSSLFFASCNSSFPLIITDDEFVFLQCWVRCVLNFIISVFFIYFFFFCGQCFLCISFQVGKVFGLLEQCSTVVSNSLISSCRSVMNTSS